ncbi:MAG: Pyrimidine permease, partial [uncultured Pseudonocardia sp.]
VDLHPARAARRDRAGRGEHRPRQGGRGDDRGGPRPLHGPRDRCGRPRDRPRQRVRRLAHHDVRREHRGHGGDPDLLHSGLLRRRCRGDPARSLPEVRRDRQRDPRWRPRRHHDRPLRDDRARRREDLGREPGGLRRPDQPRRPLGGPDRGHRRGHPADHRRLRARRNRARHDPRHRVLPHGQPRPPLRRARRRRGRGRTGGLPAGSATGSATGSPTDPPEGRLEHAV